MTLIENTILSGRQRKGLATSGFIRAVVARTFAESVISEFDVRTPGATANAGSLSGGNIQRLILSRELAPGASLLVAAQPTRGLDIAATALVRDALRELRTESGSVLLVSSDLDELFELSDRLVVMRGGLIVEEFAPPYDRRTVGDAMVGAVR